MESSPSHVVSVIIQITIFSFMIFLILIMISGLIWEEIKSNPKYFKEFFTSSIVLPPTPNTTSMSTYMHLRGKTCANVMQPNNNIYKPKAYNRDLGIKDSVFVQDIHGGGLRSGIVWRTAIIEAPPTFKSDGTIKSVDVIYTDSFGSGKPKSELNVDIERVRRRSVASDIEACVTACKQTNRSTGNHEYPSMVTVGDCNVNGGQCSCKCINDNACLSNTDKKSSNTGVNNPTWNVYTIDKNALQMQKRAREFNILEDNDSAATQPDIPDTSQCAADSGQCNSFCEALPTASQRELCKNPDVTKKLSKSVPSPRTVSTNALCNYKIPKLVQQLNCPNVEDSGLACRQRKKSIICEKNEACIWDTSANNGSGICRPISRDSKCLATPKTTKATFTAEYETKLNSESEIPPIFKTPPSSEENDFFVDQNKIISFYSIFK